MHLELPKMADIASLGCKKHRPCLVFTHTQDGRETCDMQGLALPRGLWILRDKSVMEREMEKKERSLPKPQGIVPQSHPSVTDRRAVSPALIPWSTLSTICSWRTQGPKSAPGLSQVLLQSTHSLPVLMLSDTQATHWEQCSILYFSISNELQYVLYISIH